MFYAERIEDCKIAERGVFLSMEEFLPYRRAGWSGTEATDKAANAMIAAEDAEADTAALYGCACAGCERPAL
jgi:hypothetical protein